MTDLMFLFGRNFGKCSFKSIRLEDWVPPEHVLSSWLDNLTRALTNKDLWLFAWSLTESVDALSVSSVVIERFDHLPESFAANLCKEVLAIDIEIDVKVCHQLTFTYMYGPGSPLYALKQRLTSSVMTGVFTFVAASITLCFAISTASP